MDNESWLNAEEAKEFGFVDEIIDEEEQIENYGNKLIVNNLAFDISNFKNFPKNLIKNSIQNQEITAELIEKSYPDVFKNIFEQGLNSKTNDDNPTVTVNVARTLGKTEHLTNSIDNILKDIWNAKKEKK